MRRRMSSFTVINQDAILGLKTLTAESVNCCITSPPYYGLRDYGVDGQIGLEKTPDDYVRRMVEVFQEVKRVLRKDGTVWLNIGDSYAANRSYQVAPTKWKGLDFGKSNASKVPDGLKSKDLIGIPWMLAFALRADGWYLRSDVIWSKPNVMPESVRDRPTRAHEYVFLLSKAEKYYYDHEAIKEPAVSTHPSGNGFKRDARLSYLNQDGTARGNDEQWVDIGGKRNRRTIWTIPTKPFKGAHFAVMPEDLVNPCVLAGCPIDGTVLDPFAGSGTVGVVALKHGRKFIGVELNPEYALMAGGRISASLVAEVDGVKKEERKEKQSSLELLFDSTEEAA